MLNGCFNRASFFTLLTLLKEEKKNSVKNQRERVGQNIEKMSMKKEREKNNKNKEKEIRIKNSETE